MVCSPVCFKRQNERIYIYTDRYMVGPKTNVTSEHEMAALKEGGKISTNDMATSHHRQCLPETKKNGPKI